MKEARTGSHPTHSGDAGAAGLVVTGPGGQGSERTRILEGGPTGLMEELDVGCEREGRLGEVSRVPGPSERKSGGTF